MGKEGLRELGVVTVVHSKQVPSFVLLGLYTR